MLVLLMLKGLWECCIWKLPTIINTPSHIRSIVFKILLFNSYFKEANLEIDECLVTHGLKWRESDIMFYFHPDDTIIIIFQRRVQGQTMLLFLSVF